MTLQGGNAGGVFDGLFAGTVFRINTNGTGLAVLHNFTGAEDGSEPCGSPILIGSTLYGMTTTGGNSRKEKVFREESFRQGVVFRVNMNGTDFRVLHAFTVRDGVIPTGSITTDGSTLYGMTSCGGTNGRGVVFRLSTNGTEFAVLHSFVGDSTQGGTPYGSLILLRSRLYGMVSGDCTSSKGAVFRINRDGSGFTVLHNFTGGSDGNCPRSSLVSDGSTLYGMTPAGGAHHKGVVFRINTDGAHFAVLHSFAGGSDNGATPLGSLTLVGSVLYGMTFSGGSSDSGVLFQINTNGSGFTVLHNFTGGSGGSHPKCSLPFRNSTLYGMTWSGGSNDRGVIFAYTCSPGRWGRVLTTDRSER